ncbi:hypothetical protein AD998_07480 [bacterium 336/3]|nr:hypothetical protein AD998_07480 [bacterium 336/3]
MNYPIYLKNHDGSEICKMISPTTQVFVRVIYKREGVYEYALAKRNIEPEDIQFNFSYFSLTATQDEFMKLLKAYFSQNDSLHKTFMQNEKS